MQLIYIMADTNSLWSFGTSDLIALVSAIATFSAVVVSLYLALKSKTIKPKIYVNNKMAGIRIYNAGDAKFLVEAFGVIVDKKVYIDNQARFCKLLPLAKQIDAHRSTFQEFSFNQVLLEPGDVVEVGLEYFDTTLFIDGKTYLFVVIGNKIKKAKLNISKVESKNDSDRMNYREIEKGKLKDIGFYLR